MKKILLLKCKGTLNRKCILLILIFLGVIPTEVFSNKSSANATNFSTSIEEINDKQNGLVSGVVKDNSGLPLPGVLVILKGTIIGSVTDFDGRYTINTKEALQPVLIFSFIGFKTQEVVVDGRTSINVSLEEDTQSLDEVVVVGYGTQKRTNLTGAVSQVESVVLENRPVTNVTSAMQGLMPGVTVTNASGVPGNNAGSIRIRGIGTWGNSTPLVVIDGIPGGDINILNPNDIESISVLKDAASSSIYGVRGANGVILITTKKGSGETSVSYSGYFGIQTPTALPDFVDSATYMELLNESMLNAGRNPTYTNENIEVARSGSDPNYFANTNWIQEVYKDFATQQNHNININGGDKEFNYYLSYGLLKEGGLIEGDNFNADRNNIRVKMNTLLLDRLEISGNIGYLERDYTESSSGASGIISAAHSILPLVPVRFTTGGWGYLGGQRNPVALATDGGTNDFASQEFTGNISATLNLFDGFSLRGQYGIIRSNSKRTIFHSTVNYYSPEDGSLIYRNNYPNSIDTRDYTSVFQTYIGTARYEKLINENHNVSILLGASQEETLGDNFSASRTNLATQSIGHINLGTEDQLNSGSADQNALQSIFGRVNYAFNDKYLLEGNFRYDGSTRFAKDVRWDLFSSGSVGWVFTKEGVFEGLQDVVDFGKIRASYGTQGNDRIADWAYMDILGPVGTMPIGYENTIGYRQIVVANEILTWESAIKKNFGIDLGFLNNRLQISGDYFVNNTENILLTLPLPDVFGAPYPVQNAGKIKNEGWELQFKWQDDIGDFSYGANFNISDVINKVVDLGNTEPTIGDRVRMVGEPLDAFYGLVADRLAQENDFSYNPATGQFVADFPHITSDPVAPGDIIYQDLDGDGEITLENDRKVIGSHIPRFTYGFRGDMAWKGFDFSFFIQGVGDVDGYLTGNARHALISESTFPQKIHLDRWTPENTDASYPRLSYQQTYNQRMSTYWLEDASYIRLKNIQLGYSLPSDLIKKLRISKLRLYVSGDNLFTATDFFYGYDPESPVGQGTFYPQVKTIVFGLNVNLK